ncbi:MAG: hypothetical protein EAY65_02155 [Alphaproteobacteria bacterium]|nr:MAG: hypothetical protein EAY65_02155 [Alphaproteobacteria bacterium]
MMKHKHEGMRYLTNNQRRRLAQRDLERYRDITNDVEESDFVPYACFFDEHTIITKNGEVCQTIKITGLNRETFNAEKEASELRSLIRETLKRHVPNDSFAVWLHTIRSNQKIDISSNNFPDEFSKSFNEAWVKANSFEHQFTNEVYITIVHEGETSRILQPKRFIQGLLPTAELRSRNRFIEKIHMALEATVNNIIEDLSEYGVTRLGIYKENGIYYSEQLRFLEKIINFVDRPMPVVEMDLCHYLTTGEITFSFNAMEVRSAQGRRRFAAILTLKEYKEASLGVIDQFLQLPMEFIVTQTVNFVRASKILFEYQEISNYQRLSEDPDITQLSELRNLLDSNRNNPNDYGEQQLTVFILSDTIKVLEENIKKSIAYFAKFGMVLIREDLKFQETYWAQLPGNFVFVSRMQPTYTSHIAGFANLHTMPIGQQSNNHWGEAVSTILTASGTPYFFNFHRDYVGHTAVIGNDTTGRTVIVNFLLAQSMRFRPDFYLFDMEDRMGVLCEKLGGRQIFIPPINKSISGVPQPLLFNPFSLQPNSANMQFLTRWLSVLARALGYAPTPEEKQIIESTITQIYALPTHQRSLGAFYEAIKDQTPSYARAMTAWVEGGKYGHIFTASGEGMLEGTTRCCFSISRMMDEVALQATIPSLLLQILTERVGKKKMPCIIAMHQSWQILMQTHIATDLSGWMQYLTRCNTILLSMMEDLEGAEDIPLSHIIAEESPTHIFMPEDDPCDDYATVFGLSKSDYAYLEMMDVRERHFLVKRGYETVVGELNMTGMEDFLPILAGNQLSSYNPYGDIPLADEEA